MARERTLAIVLVSMLIFVSGSAAADDNQLELNSEILNLPEKGWYGSGEVVEISASIDNQGEMAAITIDPSCNFVLRIWQDNSIIVDDSNLCSGQSRGMDIDGFSTTELDVLTWDLKDGTGEFVKSGDYRIEYFIPNQGMSSFTDVHVQTPFESPDSLELEVIATARDGVHKAHSPTIITLRLFNNYDDIIAIDAVNCKINFNGNLIGNCSPVKLEAYQIHTIAQFTVIPEIGINEYEISLGDQVLAQTIIIDAVENPDLNYDPDNYADLNLEIDYEGDDLFYELETFDSDLIISNDGDEPVSLNYSNSCKAEMWVVDATGNLVADSRLLKDCNELEVLNIIPTDETRSVKQMDWTFFDMDGCMASPGELLVIVEMPEFGLFASEGIEFIHQSNMVCENQDLTLNIEQTGQEDLIISPTLTSDQEVEIIWYSGCNLEFTILNLTSGLFGSGFECNEDDVVSTKFTDLELEELNLEMNDLPEGTYFLRIDSNSNPAFTVTTSFEWTLPEESPETEQEVVEDDTVQVSRFVAGTWSSTTTDSGTCWLLNTPDEGILTLNSAPGLAQWSPSAGIIGQYKVVSSDASPECLDFASDSIVIEEVMSEDLPNSEDEAGIEKEDSSVVPVNSQEEGPSPVIVTTGVVVVSAGLLSLLVGLISTNEGLRIPTTAAGLWLLGLIGKTNETSDGRYQRGRLMGYLTANPGCHFRALMAALEMSNGQITHHLKVLENEDRIWRKSDGRLVRFYPFTSNLHPGLDEDELPLPPLSPDPNSLQGKILRLLDQDGTMNKYPTQVDLAVRLEKSQQLISHHLRTLQKYGLVEKKRSGVKNRYKLTREALFLLETTDY